MLKKIDFIVPVSENSSLLATYTRQLKEACEQENITAREIMPPSDKKNPEKFIQDLINNAPDCTLCFNGILPDPEGRFLADLLYLPNISYIIDAPTIYYDLAKSKYSIIASIDQEFTHLFEESGALQTLFLPIGAPIDFEPVPPLEELP